MLGLLFLFFAEMEIHPFDARDFEIVKASVGVHLKDEESARWRLEQPKALNVYCGWVNSKNSFGAYEGWQPFAVQYIKFENDYVRVMQGPSLDQDNSAVRHFLTLCEESGFSLQYPPAIPDN